VQSTFNVAFKSYLDPITPIKYNKNSDYQNVINKFCQAKFNLDKKQASSHSQLIENANNFWHTIKKTDRVHEFLA
jgi:hypothetical protein